MKRKFAKPRVTDLGDIKNLVQMPLTDGRASCDATLDPVNPEQRIVMKRKFVKPRVRDIGDVSSLAKGAITGGGTGGTTGGT